MTTNFNGNSKSFRYIIVADNTKEQTIVYKDRRSNEVFLSTPNDIIKSKQYLEFSKQDIELLEYLYDTYTEKKNLLSTNKRKSIPRR